MFKKKKYCDDKILVEIDESISRDIYEPVARKIGGVWNPKMNGWLFDARSELKIEQFIKSHNTRVAETQNKEYYTKFAEEPSNYNTPSSTTSSTSGLNEAFELIQELFDRITELEKTVGELSRRLRK